VRTVLVVIADGGLLDLRLEARRLLKSEQDENLAWDADSVVGAPVKFKMRWA